MAVYADDTTLYATDHSGPQIRIRLQSALTIRDRDPKIPTLSAQFKEMSLRNFENLKVILIWW